MDLHPFLTALLGGICIGAAAAIMMVAIGRVTGISGILYNGLHAPVRNTWSVVFLAGLILGAGVHYFGTGAAAPALDASLPMLVAAGFTVGVGTRLGSGCTSGHGICGIGRVSPRSLVAVATFMATGIAAAVTVHLIFGGKI